MPPQPLRSVRRRATALVDHDALLRHPQLAARIASAIALWARIDAELGAILAFMLKGDVRPSIAMYAALTSSQAQMAALEAAARASLAADDRKLFGAVLVLVKRAGAKRNKIAHWLWGESPEIKDALILFDPDSVLDHHTRVKAFVDKLSDMALIDLMDFTTPAPQMDTSNAFVYRDREFVEIITEFLNTLHITARFSAMLIDRQNGPITDSLRSQLLAMPQIQEELKRIP